MLVPYIQALRPTQWSKNVFVLAPLVFAEFLDQPDVLSRAALAFAGFSALASCIYLLNDIADRERDAQHPRKRLRPIASGAVSVVSASIMALLLLAGAAGVALHLGNGVPLLFALYLGTNIAYSAGLKRVVILDAMLVSSGFVLRVLAGAAAIGVAVSNWLLLCSSFLALFLTFSKRRHEILLLSEAAASQREVLDRYSPRLLDQLINVVTASTVLSYSLYATDEQTASRFGSDGLILTIPFVLFGVFRYLYLVYQVRDERNPTEALLVDAPFVINFALYGLCALYVIYWT